MDLHDTARVLHPVSPIEYRLGTITAVEPQPDGPHGNRYRLRFPSGEQRRYYATEITRCRRDDDHDALVNALTAACQPLVTACRIAYDHDDQLSVVLYYHTVVLLEAARVHLGVTLGPTHLIDPITNPATEPSTPTASEQQS
ncbi:hypothetical protein [Salinispora cortesiana]|uniref:hypothetical protein n=1 Tax=Salinispora cortesiana TaxID=1305843 RepID=UPI00042908EE|nr:hypothetical protein [Salinispora cortesiana]